MDEIDENVELGTKKKKKKMVTAAKLEPTEPEVPDYTYEQLLAKVYINLKDNDVSHKAITLPPPKLVMKGSKRTQIENFKEIYVAMRRPYEHVMEYVQIEIGNLVSIDENKQKIILLGRFESRHIKKLLTNYVTAYICCKSCKSCNTDMEKFNRLVFVKCGDCNSIVTVESLKKGYQAQIGKRRNKEAE